MYNEQYGVDYGKADYSQVGSSKAGRVYFGARAGLRFRFFMGEVHNPLKSEELGYEYNEPTEFCEFIIDSKNKYVPKIDKHLFAAHPEILQDYHLWKKGVESGVTMVKDWDIISPAEKGQLYMAAFDTVEAVAQADEAQLMAIGTNWKDLQRKAKQHVAAKDEDGIALKIQEEKDAIRAELSKKDEQIQKLTDMVGELMSKIEAKVEQPKKVVKKADVKE